MSSVNQPLPTRSPTRGCVPAHQPSSPADKKALSGLFCFFFNDITPKRKFPTWRPAGCWRGRSGRSRGAPPPQASTSVPANTPCLSLSDGALTPGRRRTSAGRSNEVGLSQPALPPLQLQYSHHHSPYIRIEIKMPASSRRPEIATDPCCMGHVAYLTSSTRPDRGCVIPRCSTISITASLRAQCN